MTSDGSEYYTHTLLHAFITLALNENEDIILRNDIEKCFELKKYSIGIPKTHLGGSFLKAVIDNLAEPYAFSSSQCEKSAINIVERYLRENGLKNPNRVEIPIQTS